MTNKIKIDDKEYDFDALSEAAKTQLMHARIIESEVAKLEAQIAIYQTARIAYDNALKEELEKLNMQDQSVKKKKK